MGENPNQEDYEADEPDSGTLALLDILTNYECDYTSIQKRQPIVIIHARIHVCAHVRMQESHVCVTWYRSSMDAPCNSVSARININQPLQSEAENSKPEKVKTRAVTRHASYQCQSFVLQVGT